MFNFLKNKNQDSQKSDSAEADLKSNVTQNKNPNETHSETQNPAQENSDGKISFDEFSKVEMTVGEVIEAIKVENADRLLKLKVDFGNETRQIVSGIAEYFEPADLIGKKYPFVTNLEPREIRGEESNGMIMAAKDKAGNFSLLSVNPEITKGTRLS